MLRFNAWIRFIKMPLAHETVIINLFYCSAHCSLSSLYKAVWGALYGITYSWWLLRGEDIEQLVKKGPQSSFQLFYIVPCCVVNWLSTWCMVFQLSYSCDNTTYETLEEKYCTYSVKYVRYVLVFNCKKTTVIYDLWIIV